MHAPNVSLAFALSLLAALPACDLDPTSDMFRGVESCGDGGTGGGSGSDTGGLGTTETGDGDGDGDGDAPAILCGGGDFAYIEYDTWCDAGYDVVCGFGSFLEAGTSAVCCIGTTCMLMPFEQGCPQTHVRVCDTL
jgi:hypothetical protein